MADKNILLLEAGAAFSFIPQVPVLGPMWQGTSYDWQYLTEPQEHACKALHNRQSKWPRGKIFGGSHLLSDLIQMMGSDPEEYRCYIDPRQPLYNYETEIGQYFEAYEKLMNHQRVPFESEFSRLLKLAASEIDGHAFHNPNVSVRNGVRFTTASLYKELNGAKELNHTLLFNAMVNRLILDSSSQHVDGVEFIRGGVPYVAKARKSVIMSAGVIGTPAILLRSGIGPKEDLESLNIYPHIDLPVGRNLQDHVATGIDLVTVNSSVNTGILDMLSTRTLYEYLWQGAGLIAMPGCDLIGTLKVLNSSKYDDLQFMVIPVALNSDHGLHLRKILNLRDDVYYDYFHPQSDGARQAVTILPAVLKPKSMGVLRLRSSDPLEAPIIDPKYLSHPDDRKVLLEGIRIIKELVQSEPMQRMGAQIRTMPFPGCESHPFDTDAYWHCYIEHVTLTSYHPAGTCRMGSCPEESVVDYHFKVHGVDNLYVVDASVMPELPAANPIATINMLALRFVDHEL